jgi:hypothetical protein
MGHNLISEQKRIEASMQAVSVETSFRSPLINTTKMAGTSSGILLSRCLATGFMSGVERLQAELARLNVFENDEEKNLPSIPEDLKHGKIIVC